MSGGSRAEIVVDLDAIRHNVRTLRELTGVAMITVVKADAYGHGMLPVARAAREAGAEWLAVATLDEVRRLRAAGDTGRLLTWLTVPDEQYDDAIRADVDLTAYSVAELDEVAAAATDVGSPARGGPMVEAGHLDIGDVPARRAEKLDGLLLPHDQATSREPTTSPVIRAFHLEGRKGAILDWPGTFFFS